MSDEQARDLGTVVWKDLTVPDASGVRDFYASVLGWTAKEHDMGEYADYMMFPAGSSDCVAGICHARGPNANIPAQWLMYVKVADVAASAERCTAGGGTVVDGPRTMGKQQFCIVQDPAGAVIGLIGD